MDSGGSGDPAGAEVVPGSRSIHCGYFEIFSKFLSKYLCDQILIIFSMEKWIEVNTFIFH